MLRRCDVNHLFQCLVNLNWIAKLKLYIIFFSQDYILELAQSPDKFFTSSYQRTILQNETTLFRFFTTNDNQVDNSHSRQPYPVQSARPSSQPTVMPSPQLSCQLSRSPSSQPSSQQPMMRQHIPQLMRPPNSHPHSLLFNLQ